MIGNRIGRWRPILIADHPVGMAFLLGNWATDRRVTRIAGRLDDHQLISNMFDISLPTGRSTTGRHGCQSFSGMGLNNQPTLQSYFQTASKQRFSAVGPIFPGRPIRVSHPEEWQGIFNFICPIDWASHTQPLGAHGDRVWQQDIKTYNSFIPLLNQ